MRKTVIFFMVTTLLFSLAFPFSISAADRLTIEAEKITIAPTIDGVITEEEWGKPFYSGTPYEDRDVIYRTDTVNEEWLPANLEIYVRWDDANLYIGAIVEENVFWNEHTLYDCWYGDSFQLDVCVNDTVQGSRWRTNTALSTKDDTTYSVIFNKPNAAMDGMDGDSTFRDAAPEGAGAAVVAAVDNTVTYEMTFPWKYYGASADIQEGHQRLINFQFYLADGSMAAEGTSFPGTSYLGSIRYGTVDAEGNGLYPLVKLIAEKNPPETTPAPETTPTPETSSTEDTSSDEQTTTPEDSDTTGNNAAGSDTTDASADKSKGMDAGIIVGIVAAVIVIAAVVLIVLKKKK